MPGKKIPSPDWISRRSLSPKAHVTQRKHPRGHTAAAPLPRASAQYPGLRLGRRRGMRQTLEGSFSAVSKPNFASKYAFESSRRDLHNAPLCTTLQSQNFVKKICQNFPKMLLNEKSILQNPANYFAFLNRFLKTKY